MGLSKMYLFIGDESNTTQSEGAKFFIYGGLLVEIKCAPDINSNILGIRQDCNYSPGDKLKFDTHTRPKQVSIHQHKSAKEQILDKSNEFGVKFMAYAVHQGISGKRRNINTWQYALNTLLNEFNRFLNREDVYGMCLLDRFADDMTVLKNIHHFGVNPIVDESNVEHRLERIWCFGTVCIDTTHLASMVDIVLGAFRYCMSDMAKSRISKELYKKVRPLMLHSSDDITDVEDWGLFFRPKRIGNPEFKRDYDALRNRLKQLE